MDKMTERVEIQFTPRQVADCKEASEKSGLKLAVWIRMVAIRASGGEASDQSDATSNATNK